MVICDNMNEEGWKKKLVDGEWEHYCLECVESEVELEDK